jgi:polyhydroxybutyrate depolymerase
MLKQIVSLSLACLALLLQPAARAADACTDMRPGPNHVTLLSGGQKQDVDLVMPASLDHAKRVPLVIGLHPSGGTGATFDQDTGLSAAATAKGFAVMFPDGGVQLPGGEGRYWNIPGVPLVSGGAVPKDTRDDVRFIADAIDHLVKHSCVDARRIYVTGFSGGARMSSMVGCRLADRVAAVAPVSGLRAGRAAAPDLAEPDVSDCIPSRPLTVLAIHGTDDPTNPFLGDDGPRWGYSVERAAARWASLDHCGVAPALEKIAAHVTRVRYGACTANSEVVLYRIEAPRDQGGGHVWPGGKRDLSTRAAGAKPTIEVDATATILEFFSRH